MASETIGANNLKEKQRWGEISKVYTRKFHNKRLKNSANDTGVGVADAVVNSDSGVADAGGVVTNGNGVINGVSNGTTEKKGDADVVVVSENLQTPGVENGKEVATTEQNLEELNGNGQVEELAVVLENGNGEKKEVVTKVDNKVRINLGASNSNDEFEDLRNKLISELDQVRSLVKELEAKEVELSNACSVPVVAPIPPVSLAAPIAPISSHAAPIAPIIGYGQSQHLDDEMMERRGVIGDEVMMERRGVMGDEVMMERRGLMGDEVMMERRGLLGDDVMERRGLMRVHSEVGSVAHLESRPFRPVSGPMMESNDFGDRRVLLRRNSEVGSLLGGQDRRALMRVNSEVGGQDYRPFRQLSVSVMDNNNHIYGNGEFVEKEKRTPKANQFYRNSEFLLGKDRLPPESNKKVKSNGGRKHGGGGFSIDRHRNQAFKNCGNLLQRLMKHKHGWVFNEPVNARLLGLHDYHDIIKHPMDLGTIKNKLAQNLYNSPTEFSEDVRLTFSNAMTYNPPGQDVHVMAAQLSEIFEEKWAAIEAEYNHEWRYEMMHYGGVHTPTSRKGPPSAHLSMRALDRSQSMSAPGDSRLRHSIAPVSRTPVPKKPKAKDPNKRDMTYEEKQKLSTNLQSLPSEKLDNIVQIIKKRNSTVNQHDDEIEVDIDSVDVETLWELDRLVTNYKKSLSKNKRKAEMAQARAEAAQYIRAQNPAPPVMVPPIESERAGELNVATGAPNPVEKQHNNINRSSSSSSSSSSDSGSSSSDSDSDSSSADGSDAAHSPRG